jgi:CelD/BcsL family acetyltransferase involved in cellulose biosynthesis
VFEVAVENLFNFASAEYALLFAKSSATAFQHPAWLTGIYRRLLSHNKAAPLIIVVRNSIDKSLAMVLPLVRRRYGTLRVIEFADLRVSDYTSAVTDPATFDAINSDRAARHGLLAALKPYDVLRLGKLQDGAMPLNTLFGVNEQTSMGVNAYATSLEGSFEDWRASRLKPSYRKELDKKLRQLHRKGTVRFAQSTTSADIQETFEALRIFRRDRFEINGGGELLQVPAYFDFYSSIALQTDFARTYTLWFEGKPIAGALGLAHRGSFLVILGGFTQTEFKNQSIGSLLFQEIAGDCIARGETLLDFTIGDEPYKLTFGAEPKPMWQMTRSGSLRGFAASVVVTKFPAARTLARNIFHRAHDKSVPALAATTPAPQADDEPVEV